MRKIRYEATGDTLVVDGGYRTRRQMGLLAAPLEQLFDVSLVSFRDAAATYKKHTGETRLTLVWVDRPTEVFEKGNPMLGLQRLSSDGSRVWVSAIFYVAEREGFPEDSSALTRVVHANVHQAVEELNGSIEIKVGRFVPGELRQVQLNVEIPPPRRTIGEADAFAESLRSQAKEGAARFLGTPEGVVEALSFAPGALVGQYESQWLEAKRELFDLTRDPQKLELAKDVAALANSGGGLIIFGFSTKSEPAGDRITRARRIDVSTLSPHRYIQVLRARIHPCPERIQIAHTGDTHAGFAYIRVGQQAEELSPFMLRQTESKSGVRTTSLTIPVRTAAQIEYTNPESIHSLIVAGRAALRGSQLGDSPG